MRIFFFDTETTGVVLKGVTIKEQPHVVEFGAVIYDFQEGKEPVLAETLHFLVRPPLSIPEGASKIHGITDEKVKTSPPFDEYMDLILTHMVLADCIVGHNVRFDMNVLYFEYKRRKKEQDIMQVKDKIFCTMESTTDLLKIPGKWGNFKWPKLAELHKFLFNKDFENAHNALADIEATARCFMALRDKNLVSLPPCLVNTLPSDLSTKNDQSRPQQKKAPQGNA